LLPSYLSISYFPSGEKESSPFFLQRTPALTPAESQLRNAASASEEPVLQVLALQHRTMVSISSFFALLLLELVLPSLTQEIENSHFERLCSIYVL